MQGFAVLGLVTLVSAASTAEAQQVDPPSTEVHVVKAGDTLWDLARRYLSDPFLWPEIHTLNRDSVSDPHWIYPDERLRLPLLGGRQVAAGDARLATDSTREQPAQATVAAETAPRASTAFASPTQAPASASAGTAASVSRVQTTAVVPVVPRGSFYGASLLVDTAAISAIGTLFDLVSSTSVPRGLDPQIHPYDRVLVRLSSEAAVGERVQFMRPERLVPSYGRVFHSTGQGVILGIVDGTATVELDRLYGRVEKGNLALRLPVYEPPVGIPQAAAGPTGVLLDLALPQPVSAVEDLAFVDLGEASGVSLGDLFEVYVPERATEAGVRPELLVGRLQVVRTTQRTSTVRIVSLEQPLLEAGLPVRLVAKLQ